VPDGTYSLRARALRRRRGLRQGRLPAPALGLALDATGYNYDQSLARAIAFALGSTVSISRPPAGGLTTAGEYMQVVLRLGGPALIALTLFALGGRVKR
jgi:hypothetical protein